MSPAPRSKRFQKEYNHIRKPGLFPSIRYFFMHVVPHFRCIKAAVFLVDKTICINIIIVKLDERNRHISIIISAVFIDIVAGC